MSSHHIHALFAPRPPLEFQPPYETQAGKKRKLGFTGISEYKSLFETKEEQDANFAQFKPIEQRKERRARIAEERKERAATELEAKALEWDPSKYTFETDSYKTAFIGRLSYLTDEHKLKREMEQYGPVKNVALVYDKNTGKPRGYGFVEFEHERDMKTAYKHADGRKIDGRRILVDVERGRTVKDWKPRRVGGGLGSSRKLRPKKTKQEKAEARRAAALAAAREKAAANARRDDVRTNRDSRGGGAPAPPPPPPPLGGGTTEEITTGTGAEETATEERGGDRRRDEAPREDRHRSRSAADDRGGDRYSSSRGGDDRRGSRYDDYRR
eukprot:CAMPEP_0202856286 /NCGR_PEP_ID=MMETSP1389-20130828/91954_1 /ASSEMBLY_ACC=CAM_ASM_000865 /TAXON_ID=302021 /ORGANISM="Rhodomonas sp., Strain CCMP768" /LENGTH=326 /DNA_ID=CAMNT_0049534931 /DNA_START=12 /DNA_END=993 /DNA_ORIENTATION=+